MVEIIEINKFYEEFKLENLNLKVEKNEFFTLLGSSGCGKSTILKLISGLDRSYSGKILIDNEDIDGKNPIDMKLSMVFQDSLLLPNLNVEDNVAFGLKMTGMKKKERLEKANMALIDLGLEGFNKRHPSELSGGQKQRVSIARALVMEPKVLLMDEPFSAIDGELRGRLQKLLKQIQEKYKSTIIFVTHDRDEAFYLSDRIAIINNGKIEQIDTPKEIYNNPKTKNIANFLGIDNIFVGEIKNNCLVTKEFKLNLEKNKNEPSNKKIEFALKAEDLRVVLLDDENIENLENNSKEDKLIGIVEEIIFKSGFYYLNIKVNNEKINVIQNKLNEKIRVDSIVAIKYIRKDIIFIGG